MTETINQTLQINNQIKNNLEEKQNNFLDSILGKAINTALDVGIRAVLPDFVEDQVINIKNNLFKYGLKDGIKQTVDDAINLGKSAIGIVTGKFENTEQVQDAIKQGGVIDGVSTVLDYTIDKAQKKGKIKSTVADMLETGKDVILKNIENNIENTMKKQNTTETTINENMENWEKAYQEKDFKSMEKEYKKIEKEIKELIPLENTIKKAREIENIHNLIKNNGQNFEITEQEKELAQKL